MQTTRLDPRVYLILDPQLCRHHEPLAVAAAAVAGGATLVQLRTKGASCREDLALARALVAALAPTGVPLIVNDRVDVALAAGAAGVHLGQDDMPGSDARALLGAGAIIGLTVRGEREALETDLTGADYVSIGGVFATRSKQLATAPVGLGGLAGLAAKLRLRGARCLTAIAGIDAANVADVIAAGVDGAAILSGICAAADPQAAAAEIRAALDAASAAHARLADA